MRIVVTGAAGFIGSHLCDRLLSDGHAVVGVDNLSAGSRTNLPRHKNFSFRKFDVRERGRILSAARGAGAIFHLAADPLVKESAQHPLESFGINATGTLCVLDAARKADVGSFVLTSSSAVYGDAMVFPTPEEHPLIPISNYAASKIAAEAYASAYSSTYGIKATVLRYANIYGTRSGHGVMHDFFFKLKRNPKELQILGNGKQAKSYLFVSDCIEATLLAQKKQGKRFDVFNVGSDRTASVDEIATEIGLALGAKPHRTYTGGRRGWVGDVSRMRLDVRKLKKRTGWKPKISLRSGIRTYLGWLATGLKS